MVQPAGYLVGSSQLPLLLGRSDEHEDQYTPHVPLATTETMLPSVHAELLPL